MSVKINLFRRHPPLSERSLMDASYIRGKTICSPLQSVKNVRYKMRTVSYFVLFVIVSKAGGLSELLMRTQPLYGISALIEDSENSTCRQQLNLLRVSAEQRKVWAIKGKTGSMNWWFLFNLIAFFSVYIRSALKMAKCRPKCRNISILLYL